MRSRSYASPEQMLFQFYGVKSWTELWERRGEIEILQAHIREGLVNPILLRRRMIKERGDREEGNRTTLFRRIANELGVTEYVVRADFYR